MSILVDLNGTIASEGKPIQKTVDYLKTVTEDIYIISGSFISKKKEYQVLLDRLGIPYVDIILNPIDQDKDISFKVNMAQTIPNLTLAIDNNKKVIAAYRAIGINTIDVKDL
jgi:Glu-tRNA(Gln) amidotransferase subunit E-like FAD-binding protein